MQLIRTRDLVSPVLAGTLTLVASIALTVVSAWLITRAWQMPPVMDLTVAVTAVRALGITRAVFRYIERLVSHDVALSSAARARSVAYERLAGSGASVGAMSRGSLLTRLGSDIDAVADVIVRAIVPVGVAAVTGVLSVSFAALLSWEVALVLAVGLVLAAVVPSGLSARAVRQAEALRARSVEAYTAAVDRVLADAVALRVGGGMEPALAQADSAARSYARAGESGASADAVGAASSLWIHGLTITGVLLVAGTAYLDGGHSPQWLAVLVLLSLAAFEAVSVLPNAAVAWTRGAGARARLEEVLRGSGALGVVPAAGAVVSDEPRLVARDLSYGRDTDLGVINLDLPFGARHEIIAPSGSGKTTLLMTLAGILPPRGGEVSVDGYSPASVSGTVVLFSAEDAHVFATTVRDNLALGAADASDEEMMEVLEAVGLADWVAELPGGLDTVLGSGAASLSGGQRRRLLLARVLLTDAPILLLDEPVEHLDAGGAAEMLEMLNRDALPGRRARRTVVVVRHPR
nr:thiol reductant ABC exporter subunit CydC [Corynebacterium efficiens]